MSEVDLMKVRNHLGMVFQEGALFDSLTVAENVGYKRTRRRTCRSKTCGGASRKCSASSGSASTSTRCRRAVGRTAPPGRHRTRDGLQAADAAARRGDDGLDPITATTIDEEVLKLRDLENVSSIVVTHQLRDAFFVATHEAVRMATASRLQPPMRRSAMKPSSSC
jgi:phospholipid/cholesterol/gamma-HCH transport system ATP-binding protein